MVTPRARKRDHAEDQKHHETGGGIAPSAPKSLRKIAGKEVANAPSALRVGPINPAVRPNDKTVEVINQPRVARLSARNREVRSRAPVNAAQFAHLFAMQAPERHAVEMMQQAFKPLPGVLAFVDETIEGHCRLPIADFRFEHSDLQSESVRQADSKSQIGNRKSAMLVECVPNFSEGRKPETVEQIAQAIQSVRGAVVLDRHIDSDHNRSVITFVAEPESVVEAAVRAVAKATELIDLRKHRGEHPRIGATDVLPFVPVSGVTIDHCVALAHQAGQRIWQELSIPVFFYERAALRPERARLENVRGKGFEQLRDEIATNPDRKPDVGQPEIHESAGAIAVGARPFLIAFNVMLQTNDLMIARRIARVVRERDGGLPFVKALGFELRSRGVVQVSMNLIDYEQTSITRAFEAVRDEAARLEVGVSRTEIVGLLPRAALDRSASYFPLLENFSERVILENLIETGFAGGLIP